MHRIASVIAGLALVALATGLAVVAGRDRSAPVRSVTESRAVAPFTRVELAGSNTVVIRVGAQQSVAVTGEHALLERVTTNVREGTLVVGNKGSLATHAPMRVAVTVPALRAVTLSGAGTITVAEVSGREFTATLSGRGTIIASGDADRVTAALTDAGTIALDALAAHDAVARLDGTGTIEVHASSSLVATLTGTGTILYSGHPTVTSHNTGTGTIVGR